MSYFAFSYVWEICFIIVGKQKYMHVIEYIYKKKKQQDEASVICFSPRSISLEAPCSQKCLRSVIILMEQRSVHDRRQSV